MLEKIAIYVGIAAMLSVYPAIKLKKVNSLSRYQDKVSKLEREIDEIKIIEQDPAKRFVKIGKVEAKIVKVREKADETMKILKLRAKWEYQKDLIKLKRKQVYLDSTVVLQPK